MYSSSIQGDMEIYDYKKSNKTKRRVYYTVTSVLTGAAVLALTGCLVRGIIKADIVRQEDELAGQTASFAYSSVLRNINSSSLISYDVDKVTEINSFSYNEETKTALYCCSNDTNCYTQTVTFAEDRNIDEVIDWLATRDTFSLKGIEEIQTYNFVIEAESENVYSKNSVDKSIDYKSGSDVLTSGTWIDHDGIYSYTNIFKNSLTKENLKKEKTKFKINSDNKVVDKFYNLLLKK